jgi:hypothetical protein
MEPVPVRTLDRFLTGLPVFAGPIRSKILDRYQYRYRSSEIQIGFIYDCADRHTTLTFYHAHPSVM